MIKDVVIMMARGIEGCGVTKFSLEQNKWFNNNGIRSTLIASSDKKWSRKTAHDCDVIQSFLFANDQEADAIIKKCNEVDVVIITSLPSRQYHNSKGHPIGCIDNFKRIISSIKTPIVLVQLDHASLSINRNAALDESINASTIMFSLSRSNDFCEHVHKLEGTTGISSFFDDTPVNPTPIFAYQVGYDFEPTKKQYWKDIKEQDPKHHKWIGRTTSWKGYKQMFKFHNNFLQGNQCLTTFEGIEKSPAYLDFKLLSDFHAHIMNDINAIDMSNGYGGLAYVFGPYNNNQMLERMSRCGFGYQLSILDQKYIENAIEYTHCEIVATGVIPVFRAAWGQRAKHRTTGIPLIESVNTGTVWLDDNDMQPALDLIKKLESDDVMRDEYRNMAYEFYKYHQDSEYIYSDMFEKMKPYIKD